MERFTTMSTEGPHIKSGLNIRLHDTCVCSSTGPAVDRLYAYEETGLTPEEVKKLIERKNTCNEIPKNSKVEKAHIHTTLYEDGCCEQEVRGSVKNLLLLMANVIHTMADGDIRNEVMLVEKIKDMAIDMIIDDSEENPENLADIVKEFIRMKKSGDKNG